MIKIFKKTVEKILRNSYADKQPTMTDENTLSPTQKVFLDRLDDVHKLA